MAAFGIADIAILSMIAVAVVLDPRCLDSDEAWGCWGGRYPCDDLFNADHRDWPSKGGAVALVTDTLAPGLNGLPPLFVLAAIHVMPSELTVIVSNTPVAIVVTPLAINLAARISGDVWCKRPFCHADRVSEHPSCLRREARSLRRLFENWGSNEHHRWH